MESTGSNKSHVSSVMVRDNVCRANSKEFTKELTVSLQKIKSFEWKEKEEGHKKLISVATIAPEYVEQRLSKVAATLESEIASLRLKTSRRAISTTGHLFQLLGIRLDPILDVLMKSLMTKAIECSPQTMRRIKRCLQSIVSTAGPSKLVHLFLTSTEYSVNCKEHRCRSLSSEFVVIALERMCEEDRGAKERVANSYTCDINRWCRSRCQTARSRGMKIKESLRVPELTSTRAKTELSFHRNPSYRTQPELKHPPSASSTTQIRSKPPPSPLCTTPSKLKYPSSAPSITQAELKHSYSPISTTSTRQTHSPSASSTTQAGLEQSSSPLSTALAHNHPASSRPPRRLSPICNKLPLDMS